MKKYRYVLTCQKNADKNKVYITIDSIVAKEFIVLNVSRVQRPMHLVFACHVINSKF